MSDRDPRRGAYAPPPDDYETFDARHAGSERRGPILLIAAAAVFVLFIAVVWNMYNQGVRDRDSAPVLTADSEPYRNAPDDPGGFETPGQDIEAYSLRDGGTGEDGGERAVRPGPEEPLPAGADELPSLRIESADADSVGAGTEAGDAESDRAETETADSPEAETGGNGDAIGALIAERGADAADRDSGGPADLTDSDAGDDAPNSETEGAAEAEAVELDSEPEPQSEPAASSGGDFVVQIGAFRTREEADEAWAAFASRFPGVASGRSPSIARADLGERGVYHRLRIAGYATRENASAACAELSSQGQDCLVASR